MSNQARGNLLSVLILLCTLGLVLYLGGKNGDIGDAFDTLLSADIKWILMAIVSWCIFIGFEAMGLHAFFRKQGMNTRYRTSLLATLIGAFYSSITPAATGGQPMQVFCLKKRNVPAGISTSCLAVKFFTFQTALLSLGALMWATHPEVAKGCIEQGRWIAITGFILNGLSVVAVLLLAINKNIVRWILTLAINIGRLLHLVKDVARTTSKADAAMNDFRASVDMLTHHPLQLLKLYLLSCVQVLGLMSISYCVYRALGQDMLQYPDILTLQFLLYIAASFTPLPGASGAQEGGFYIFFQGVFPAEQLVGALLLWRFFTYYFTLIIGFAAVTIESASGMMKHRNNKERKKKRIEKKSAEASGTAECAAENNE